MNFEDEHPLVMAIMEQYPPHHVSSIMNGIPATFVNQNHPSFRVTPLVALATIPRPDDADAIRIAKLLVDAGADVNKRDSGPGSTPMYMCAQTNKPKLMKWLMDHGAQFDMTPSTSCTTSISIASSKGNTECVAILVNTAREEDKLHLIDVPNKLQNRTPGWVAIARGFPEIVGILCKAGADLRRSIPSSYEVLLNDERSRNVPVDGSERPIQHALSNAVFSHCHMMCAASGCQKKSKNLMKCSRCQVASYCSRECQAKDYKSSHKYVCKKLLKGMDMYGDKEDKTIPEQSLELFGFEEDFGGSDMKLEYSERIFDENPVTWEYDAGPPGQPDWRRYPPKIEDDIEDLLEVGNKNFMYRPSHPECLGKYEGDISPTRPDGFSTCYIWFTDMTEREVYTGASRAVRRNGSTKPVVGMYTWNDDGTIVKDGKVVMRRE